MVAIATARPTVSYTSFPRTGPQRSNSHESTHASPGSSSWYACGAKNTATPEPNHDPPSTMITVHHKRRDGRSRAQQQEQQKLQQQRRQESTRQRRESPRSPIREQRSQPYPTTIEFTPSTPSQDPGHAPFDEPIFNDLNLQEMSLVDTLGLSLEDTFGFAENSKNDDIFENLYTGNEDEDGTFQSSIDLNPYSAKDIGTELNKALDDTEDVQNSQNSQNSQSQPSSEPMQRGRDSIFRTQSSQPSPIPPTSQQKQLISPIAAMERRRLTRARAPAHPSSVASPSPSFFTSASSALQHSNTKSILRNNTGMSGTSIHRNNTGSQRNSIRTSSRSRHRSTSRSHASRSRCTPRGESVVTSRGRRSRSRSTSIAPPRSGDDYHQNLFRGAKMIREQLLRSMSMADQAMDEAEREFMEEMIERGGGGTQGSRQQQLQCARRRVQEKDDGFDNGNIDFDYSFDSDRAGGTKAVIEPSPSRDSSGLESEGRRLDNLMSIFGTNSSTSSSNTSGLDVKRSSPEKENGLTGAGAKVEDANAPNVITPTSSMSLSSPASQLLPHTPIQKTKLHNKYASRYFQEDLQKPMIASRVPSAGSAAKSDQAQKEYSHPKYQAIKEEPQHRRPPTEEVDEALAHAQRAGPLWRSLVGNHVRFPSQWGSLLSSTSPPIHSIDQEWSKWFYVARHRVKGDKRLNSHEYGVRSRRSGGRILMRLVVREMNSQQVCREIAVGCFHPNSKGIRTGEPLPEAEDVREVWMAVRWLIDKGDEEPTLDLRGEGCNYEGVIDNFLMQRKGGLEYSSMGSALGHRRAVNNENVRAVFGDQPPMTTVDLHEDEVAEILKANVRKKLAVLPALLLLKLFLFSK